MRGVLILLNLALCMIVFCVKSFKQGPQAVIFDERVLA
jgi:hypothetical protein